MVSLERDYFEVRRGLRRECIVFPWLFSIFFDEVVREVNERATRRRVKLKDEVMSENSNKYYMLMKIMMDES